MHRCDVLPRGRFLLSSENAPAAGPGVRFVDPEADMPEAKKAPADGSYVLDGNRYHAKKGSLLPEGAEFEAEETDQPAARRAATSPAPENEAAKGPAENQGAKPAPTKGQG